MSNLTKQGAIGRLCALCTNVAERVFDWEHSADCFCGEDFDGYRMGTEVVKFIEEAVKEKIERDKV